VPSDFQDYSLVTLVGVAAHLMQARVLVWLHRVVVLWVSFERASRPPAYLPRDANPLLLLLSVC
jgi:hypothetical protein